MLVDRHPLPGPTSRRLAHREIVDWHDHAEHQLVCPRAGALHVRTDRGAWVVPLGRAVWLPAGVPHSHRAHGRTQMLTLSFPSPARRRAGAGSALPGTVLDDIVLDDLVLDGTQPTVVAVGPLLREVIVELAAGTGGTEGNDGGARPDGGGGPNRALGPADQADLYRIALRRLVPAPALRHHLPAPADPRLRDIAAILAEDPADPRTLAELGRAAGASERTLSRLFRRDTGMTFPQWRAQLRLQHAMLALAAGSSVTAAAVDSGYGNISAFIAAFREAFGVTPAAYRAEAAT
ncbi:MAG TPA: helix-turn-helix transcriptional regulator [Trebonia sp.]|nr:helix-turn-helix transcriptional regulator [Trebonia sp.]